jgi:hypothetical protein
MKTIEIPIELLESIHEDLCDLKCAWSWKQDETRCGYVDAYKALEARIQEVGALLGYDKCIIFSAESDFRKTCDRKDVVEVAQAIWEVPEDYLPYQDATWADYHHHFLKYLWIRYPDGTERRLAKVVMEGKGT